jgi:hypothetical protein
VDLYAALEVATANAIIRSHRRMLDRISTAVH